MSDGDRRTRRAFLRAMVSSAAAAAALRLFGTAAARADDAKPSSPGIPRRDLGRTGEKVSIMGLGGWHLGLPSESEAISIAQAAVDQGISFCDNANDYHDGRSEERLGKALAEGGRRERVFLMTKCCDHARTRDGSLKNLEQSLRRLRTDHVDLWQLHDISGADDPKRVFAGDGAIHALEEAKKKGLARYVGFTGHREPKLFLEMLSHDFPFDAVQMPLNPAGGHWRDFEAEVLPRLLEKGIAVIGMKSLAGGSLARSKAVTASECIRYALSLPVATLVCGMDSRDVLKQDLDIARGFAPMPPAERKALVAKLAAEAKDGALEGYKHP